MGGGCSVPQVTRALGAADFAAGHGHLYARRLLENAGIRDTGDGVFRVDFAHYNTRGDVDRVLAVLRLQF